MIRFPPGALAAVLIRLPAVAFAGALFAIPLLTAPMKAVAVVGSIGLAVAAVGVAGLWRWAITAAACILLIDYAAALRIADAPVSIAGAAAAGLALLFLLQSVEAGRCLRRASVDARVARSQALRWAGFAAATLAVTAIILALAGSVAALVPFTAAPFVAAAGALGVVLALAAALTRRDGL
jgi:hypothetical protein